MQSGIAPCMRPSKNAGKASLLLVDDDEVVRNSIAAYLEDSGFNVLPARNGVEALEIFRASSPDVLICDLRMPRMDGLELIRRIVKIGPDSGRILPIIVISGAGVMNDVVEALRLGALDYLIKPIGNLEVLEHSIRRCLERVRLHRDNELYSKRLEESLSLLEEDQTAGRQVQMKMLPKTPLEIGGYQFSYRLFPSLFLSGDFVDYCPIDSCHTLFYLADVSGHGASSAFVTTLLKYTVRNLLYETCCSDLFDQLTPARVLSHVNQGLLQSGIGKHATMVVGIIDTQANTLTYSVAGHLPLPVLCTGEKVEFVRGEGQPVGLFDEASYRDESLPLPDDFCFAIFSDGVLEILPGESIEEKEAVLQRLMAKSDRTVGDIVRLLGLHEDKDIQDDTSFLLVNKRVL